MSKTTKASTIFAYFLFTIFFTILFALLSACGGGSDKNGSDPRSTEPDPSFTSTWRVPVDSKTITLPLVDDAMYTYDFTVDWGDGSPISEITAHDDPDRIHTYEAAGDYNLVIEGTLEAWSFNNAGDKDKILSVESFGDLGYKNLSGAFYGCGNLGDFEGGVTSDVTDMTSMFEGATAANPDVSNWDVSKVTDMTNMFNASGLSTANYNAFLINLADNNASVENVTLGAGTVKYDSFAARTALDALVDDRGWTITDGGADDSIASFRSTWKTSADGETITLPLVDDAAYTYNFTVDWGDGSSSEITSFNDTAKTHTYATAGDYNLVIKGTLEAWSFNDTGDRDKILSVESFGDLGYKNLSGAFYGCSNLSVFEGGITSDVTKMNAMFALAINANPNTSHWNVSSVTDMHRMFNATNANPDVSSWDVSKVTDMNGMFRRATAANPDVSNWNVSAVTNMSSMFLTATSANPDVSSWNVSSVTNMGAMFQDATSANPDVSGWNVSSVTNMNSMFRRATSANPDVSSWNVSSVTDMHLMFNGATNANPDVSSWNVSAVTRMTEMFNASGLSTANYDAFLINLAGHDPAVSGVTLETGSIKYSSNEAQTARDTLINDRSWTINDGGDATP